MLSSVNRNRSQRRRGGPGSSSTGAFTGSQNRRKRFSTFREKCPISQNEITAPPLLRVASPELWRMIFSYFSPVEGGGTLEDRRQLLVLSQVCHQWREIAQPMLFEQLSPKTFKSLLKLKKALITFPQLAQYTKSLCTPALHSRFVSPKSQEWRTRTISYCARRKVKIELAPKDYYEMISLFSSIASLCPNIRQLTIPVSITASRGANIGFAPQFPLPPHIIENLTHLTLSPLIFPSASCKFTTTVFPNVTTLFLDGLTMRHADFIKYFSFPKLRVLIMRHLCATSTVFTQFFESIKETVKIVKFRDPYILNNRPGAEELYHDLWFVDSLNTGSILENVQHLSIPGRRDPERSSSAGVPMQFHTLSSLKSLSIGQSERSGFGELFILPPSITKLTVAITTSTPHGCFHVASKLEAFIKQSNKLAPNLKNLVIMWYLQRSSSSSSSKDGDDNLELKIAARHLRLCKILAFCLAKSCENAKLKHSIVVERMTDTSEHCVKGRELMAPGPHRWTKNPNNMLPTLDRALKKMGIKPK